MPFQSVQELPDRIKRRFPGKGARRAFVAAFNSAFAGTCKDGGRQGNRDRCSFAVAMTAAQNVTKGDSVDTAVSKALHVHDEDEKKRRRKKKQQEDEQKTGKVAKFLKGLVGLLGEEQFDRLDSELERLDNREGAVSIVKAGAIVKTNDEWQVFYSPVFVPDEEHGQGLVTTGNPDESDVVNADEIRKAAHDFLATLAVSDGMGVGFDHASSLPHLQAQLVESWIEKADVTYETPNGPELIPDGTWMIGVHISDADLWKSVKSGERTGVSMEGTGIRTLV